MLFSMLGKTDFGGGNACVFLFFPPMAFGKIPLPPSFVSKGGGVLRNRFHPCPLRAQKVGVGESSRLGFAARKTDCSAVLTFRMGAWGGACLGGVTGVRLGWGKGGG